MRELILSISITFLTGVILFIYFRNRQNSLDEKINLVFNTIQEHNEKMQTSAEEELQRFNQYQSQQQMHINKQHNEATPMGPPSLVSKNNSLMGVSPH